MGIGLFFFSAVDVGGGKEHIQTHAGRGHNLPNPTLDERVLEGTLL